MVGRRFRVFAIRTQELPAAATFHSGTLLRQRSRRAPARDTFRHEAPIGVYQAATSNSGVTRSRYSALRLLTNLAEVMRILHILDHSPPLQSGYVIRTLGIVNQQRALGWEPVLLTSGKHYAPGPARERIGEWEFLRTRAPTGLAARLPWVRELAIVSDLDRKLDEVIGDGRPQILHAHSPVLNALSAIRAGRRHAIPIVYEIRALWEDAAASHGTHGQASLRYLVTRDVETRALHRADAVTTICEGLRADASARGVPADKVTVIPNAVDRNKFAGPGIPDGILASRLGLSGKIVLGFFGSFYAYEGLDLLLRAVPDMRHRRADIAILLVGG